MKKGNGLIVGALLAPALAHSQTYLAEISFNAEAWGGGGWYFNYNPSSQSGFPAISGTDFSDLGVVAADADASLANGTVGAAGFTVVNGGVDEYLGSAGALLEDTLHFAGFSGTKQVVFGIAGSPVVQGVSARASVTDGLEINGTTEASQTLDTVSGYQGNSGSTTYFGWQNTLTYTATVQAGVAYELMSYGGADVNSVDNLSSDLGSAVFDPQWFLTVPSGVSYTTASGYQLPNSAPVPEPSSLVAFGIPLVGVLARRRHVRKVE